MEQPKSSKVVSRYLCEKCNYKCSRMCDFNKHLLTAKHITERLEQPKSSKVVSRFMCDCGKTYKVSSGLWKHKKVCSRNTSSITCVENREEKPSMMDIITQNKEIMNLLVLQNKEQAILLKEQSDTIRELIPKIGNNNTITTTTNNQFNLQNFLTEDCKDALNFSEFIKQINISFNDLENQAENGYIKGITKLFIESLQGLGQNKRPIHCSDKKRKTLYLKENDEWDKEGSLEVLRKGINEVTRRTFEALIKSKEDNAEEYEDNESDFSNKCVSIQKNLTPNYPRDTTICKVIEIITQNSGITEK